MQGFEADVVLSTSAIEQCHRPYRAALGIDVVLVELLQGKGTRYDSDVVDCCVKLFKELGFELP